MPKLLSGYFRNQCPDAAVTLSGCFRNGCPDKAEIRRRYEKHSTIITTNQPFSKWAEVFDDSVIAAAILDRLIHHSTIINITGKSYRTKDKLVVPSKQQMQS
jgi:hypothetical protein